MEFNNPVISWGFHHVPPGPLQGEYTDVYRKYGHAKALLLSTELKSSGSLQPHAFAVVQLRLREMPWKWLQPSDVTFSSLVSSAWDRRFGILPSRGMQGESYGHTHISHMCSPKGIACLICGSTGAFEVRAAWPLPPDLLVR